VTLIRLNRPEALNALNTALLAELGQALAAAQADDARRLHRHHRLGQGLRGRGRHQGDVRQVLRPDVQGRLLRRRGPGHRGTRKPIIAAVAGYALGGGCELAMMCDFILAADTAKFGQPEINLGVAPGIGGTQRLTRLVGKSKAMDMILTGRMMGAEEAERAGLASRIFPADTLVDEALAVAARIAAQSPLATAMNKELVNAAYETTLSTGVQLERRLFHSLFAFDDQKEGMAAFVEKRKPAFKGS
jgi:enoyl-CoA hydratase/carnithine racemase